MTHEEHEYRDLILDALIEHLGEGWITRPSQYANGWVWESTSHDVTLYYFDFRGRCSWHMCRGATLLHEDAPAPSDTLAGAVHNLIQWAEKHDTALRDDLLNLYRALGGAE